MTLVEAVFLTLAMLLAAFCALAAHMRKRYPNDKHLPWMIAAIGAMATTLMLAALGFSSTPILILTLVMFTASAALTCQTFLILSRAMQKWPQSLAIACLLTAISSTAIAANVPYIYATIPFHAAVSLLLGEAGWNAHRYGRHDNISKTITLCLSVMAAIFMLRGFGYSFNFDSNSIFEDIKKTRYELATILAVAIPGMTMTMLLIYRTLDQTADHYREMSCTDALTGLMNRSAFTTEIASAKVGSWLILCDIDHFKRVNDTWGHAAGDVALKCLSALLKNLNMPAARIGGEEFAIYLPLATPSQARLVAEGLRTAFSLQQIEGLPVETRLTASFGVAGWEPSDNFDCVFKRADTALYRAKADGRDKVVMASAYLSADTKTSGAKAA